MRRKIINIDTEEGKKEAFEKFNSVNSKHQAHILFGISDNKEGSEQLKKVAQQVGFDLNVYKQRKEKPKRYCLQCGEEILSRHNQKFCCQSCATTYQNLHTVKTEETKKKISESLKQYNKENPRFCNEQTLKRKQRNTSDKNNKGTQKNVKIRKYCLRESFQESPRLQTWDELKLKKYLKIFQKYFIFNIYINFGGAFPNWLVTIRPTYLSV